MNYLVISNRLLNNLNYFRDPEALEEHLKQHLEIKTLIFVFWSWIVPKRVLKNYKCYGFHTGPLLEGKGRGGSPIDNLQKLGVEITTLCAFEMNEKIDEGRVILAVPIWIDRTKEEVINGIAWYASSMVSYIIEKQPDIPKVFKRLKNV